jgi:hypothetical protein
LIPAPQPKGWDNQISNDLILNYKLNIVRNFVKENSFVLNGNAEAIAGTMNDKLSTGLSVMIGKMNGLFQSSQSIAKKKWEAYLFGHSFVSVVGYDATLQGGVFNKRSPYTLSASQISRFTLQNQIGLMLHHKRFSIEFSESFLSKEFKTGISHKWGGVGIAIELK